MTVMNGVLSQKAIYSKLSLFFISYNHPNLLL